MRDRAIPGAGVIRKVSHKRETPVAAILLGAVIAALFTLLVHVNPSKPIHILWFTYPKGVNVLFVLVSFGVSGIYLSFLMITVGSLIARLRGWEPRGSFRLGKWGYPVTILGVIYGAAMLVNVVYPSGLTSGRAELFNYDWITFVVILIIVIIGGIYYVLSQPQKRIRSAEKNERAEASAILQGADE